MLNIISRQEKANGANQNYKIPAHTFENMVTVKTRDNQCWGGHGDEGTPVHCWWDCKSVQLLWQTVQRFLKKLKRELPRDPTFPCLGM